MPDVFCATTLTSFTLSLTTGFSCVGVAFGSILASSFATAGLGGVATSGRAGGVCFFGDTVLAVFIGLTVCATGSFFVTFGDATAGVAAAPSFAVSFSGLVGAGLLSTTAGFASTFFAGASTGVAAGSFFGDTIFSTAGFFCGDLIGDFGAPFCLLSFCGLDGAGALVVVALDEAAAVGAASTFFFGTLPAAAAAAAGGASAFLLFGPSIMISSPVSGLTILSALLSRFAGG